MGNLHVPSSQSVVTGCTRSAEVARGEITKFLNGLIHFRNSDPTPSVKSCRKAQRYVNVGSSRGLNNGMVNSRGTGAPRASVADTGHDRTAGATRREAYVMRRRM